MVGGGDRRWPAALLQAYVPIKDLAELTAVLEELAAAGFVAHAGPGLYVLTDEGRRELGKHFGY